MLANKEIKRCTWCLSDQIYIDYHDKEWGKPIYDSRELFEMLCLEGAQAGLSWITVLKKRENYRRLFDDFDANKMALYDDAKKKFLLGEVGIIRNKLKIQAFITNAQLFLMYEKDNGSFSDLIWSFVDGKPILNTPTDLAEVPAATDASIKMSKELKMLGFKFIGSTICYAFMQAAGLVNDHVVDCAFK
jgi:DNA-3-methyladenine glycosylase I